MSIRRDLPYVLNLANSIMGVSLLAMPFCFMRCGIVLGTLLLLISTYLTVASCEILMRAAVASKKRSYEFLAKLVFGSPGKLAVEISVAGVQLGICIAFHVIIGDLGPSLISKWTGYPNDANLRLIVMILACFISLPLSMMKKLDSLLSLSAFSIGFYVIMVLTVIFNAIPNLFEGSWMKDIYFWRTENIFQCLPIFAMAFGCQTQMFLLYDNLPDPSLSSLKSVTSHGVILCMLVYLLTGFSGYIAYYKSDIVGDILLSFPQTFWSEVLKMGFVVSVALSFPLMVFPCRNSFNTLLFSQTQASHGHGSFVGPPPMSDKKFNILTATIILGTLCIAINFPNVEFILGLNGSTMGCMISFIFPAVLYLRVMESKQDGKAVARIVFVVGILVLCVSTYTTLQKNQESTSQNIKSVDDDDFILPAQFKESREIVPGKNQEDKKPPDIGEKPAWDVENKDDSKEINKDPRKEPPIPQAPQDDQVTAVAVANVDSQEKEENKAREDLPADKLPDKHTGEEDSPVNKNADDAVVHKDVEGEDPLVEQHHGKDTGEKAENLPKKNVEKRSADNEQPVMKNSNLTKLVKREEEKTEHLKDTEKFDHSIHPAAKKEIVKEVKEAVDAERHGEIKQILDKIEVQQNIQQDLKDLMEQNKVLMEEIKEVKKKDTEDGVNVKNMQQGTGGLNKQQNERQEPLLQQQPIQQQEGVPKQSIQQQQVVPQLQVQQQQRVPQQPIQQEQGVPQQPLQQQQEAIPQQPLQQQQAEPQQPIQQQAVTQQQQPVPQQQQQQAVPQQQQQAIVQQPIQHQQEVRQQQGLPKQTVLQQQDVVNQQIQQEVHEQQVQQQTVPIIPGQDGKQQILQKNDAQQNIIPQQNIDRQPELQKQNIPNQNIQTVQPELQQQNVPQPGAQQEINLQQQPLQQHVAQQPQKPIDL